MDIRVAVTAPLQGCLLAAVVLAAPPNLRAEDVHPQKIARTLQMHLPEGWQLLAVTEHYLILRRDKPVALYNAISLPTFESREELQDYVKDDVYDRAYAVVFRFARRVNQAEYQRLKAANQKALTQYDELRKTVRDIAHKFDDFLPEGPEEEARVAKYQAAVKKLRFERLPDYHTSTHSVYVEDSVLGGDAFFSLDVGAVCRRATKLVTEQLKAYDE